jgi:hypothetical protein
MSQWPKIDPRDPTYQRDLASLQVRGETAEAMDHGGHGGGTDHSQMQHGQMRQDEHGGQDTHE